VLSGQSYREVPLEAAIDIASKIPVVEGGPAGSGVVEATIRSMAERLGAILLGNIFVK
jgi:hypothetical protein